MKQIINLFLLLACTFSACRQNSVSYLSLIENDWKKENLKGRVKKVVNKYYDQDILARKLMVEYNERGFKMQEVDSFFGPAEKKSNVITYQYDTVNNVTIITRLVDGQMQQWKDKYDQAGNKTEGTVAAARTIYTYDKKNRLLEEMTYNLADTAQRVRTVYEYLSNGVKRSAFFHKSTLLKRTEVYENDTMRTQKVFDNAGVLNVSWLYKLDTAGHIIYAEEKDADNKLMAYSRNYYNKYNDHVMVVNFRPKENWSDTLFIEYVYDNMGNFIKAGGNCTREITYW